MKFIISRTSDYDPNQQPCEGTVQEEKLVTDRTHELYFHGWFAKNWNNYGENHRVEGEYHVRETRRKIWVLELETLEALITFQDNYGEIVIKDNMFGLGKEVEIYDTYRE